MDKNNYRFVLTRDYASRTQNFSAKSSAQQNKSSHTNEWQTNWPKNPVAFGLNSGSDKSMRA
jgi:hypothetical protein